MTDDNQAIDLIAHFTAKEGSAETVTELLLGYAEEVRAEPGNVIFEPHRKVEDGNDFVVVERYADQAAFDAHLGGPANARFEQAVAPHRDGGVELMMLTPRLG